MVEENIIPVFNVKVRGQDNSVIERKAMDLQALNEWLDAMMIYNNPLILGDDKAPEQMTVSEYKGLVNRRIIIELNTMVKKQLGIIQEEPPKPEPAKPEKKKPAPQKAIEPEVMPEEPEQTETNPVIDEDIIDLS